MLVYKIVHHTPGRIRLMIPALKGLSLSALEAMSSIPLPEAIERVRPNPLTGSLVIIYDPKRIDILDYLTKTIADTDMAMLLEGRGKPLSPLK